MRHDAPCLYRRILVVGLSLAGLLLGAPRHAWAQG
jgi:hypothetical protein